MDGDKNTGANGVMPPVAPEEAASGSSKPVMLALVLVLVVILGFIGYTLYTRGVSKQAVRLTRTVPAVMQTTPASSPSALPTPIISPVTQGNADRTLSNTDNSLQKSLNQVDTDLSSLSAIDSAQDTTNGLQ